jgi:cysteine desulfurase
MRRIYVDHATTTPIAPEVRAAMRPFLEEEFGRPGTFHLRETRARQAVEAAREQVASLLSVPAEEILFTASATEANNLALKGLVLAAGTRRGRILAAATEHISVLHPLRTLEKWGHPVSLLPVDRHGLLDPGILRSALTDDTLLVSVAHASAEIGTLQPIEEIGRIVHARGAVLHCDATLTAGALPAPRGPDRPDLISLTSHLFYGPKGAGALCVRRGLRLLPLIEGGTQEGGLRAGTEAVAAIAGFGAAADLAAREMVRRADHAAGLAGTMKLILERLPGVILTGHPEARVPGHLSLCVRNIEAESLLGALDDLGIEAASGSACTTGAQKPSHVLQAIGIDAVLARGALTLAFGEENREGDPAIVAAALRAAVGRLRALSPLADA